MELNSIHHGDCLELMKGIKDKSIDMILTSPPYYNAKDYSHYDSVEEYMGKMKDIFMEARRIIKPSRMCIVNVSPVLVERESRNKQSVRIPIPFYFVPMMEELEFEFLEDIIWEKPEGAAINRNGGFFRHRKPVAYKPNIVTEYILVFKKKAPFLIDKVLQNNSLVYGEYERSNVWKINPETNSNHPAPFPEELAEKCVKYYSYEDEVVLDVFAGSGTTGIACINTNRNYILMEKEEKYYNIIQERIANHKPLPKVIQMNGASQPEIKKEKMPAQQQMLLNL